MNMTISDTPHLPLESAYALSALVGSYNPHEEIARRIERRPGEAAAIKAHMQTAATLFDRLAENIDVQSEDIQLLCHIMPEFDDAPFALYIGQLRGDTPTKEDMFTMLASQLIADARITDEKSLAAFFEQASLSYETRGQLLLIWTQYDALKVTLFKKVAAVQDILRANAHLYEAEARTAAQWLREAIARDGLEALLAAHNIPVTFEADGTYTWYPHILFPNMLRATDRELFFGTHMFEISAILHSETPSREKLQEVLRLLGDRTKFDILTLLSHQSLYGGELAARLDLTPATISHHINQLTSQSLVHIVKEGTRAYYHTDREVLSTYLKAAAAHFGADHSDS